MRLDLLATCAFALIAAGTVPAQPVTDPVVTYEFNGTYAADQSGKPALNPFAPGTSTLTFSSDTVTVGLYSSARTVLVRGGAMGEFQANQAGVELTTTGLLTNPNVYSIDMVFSMNTSGIFERLLNTNNASDNGLYVQGPNVDLFDNAGHNGSHTFTYGSYHHMGLTYDGTTANEYLDGALDITLSTTAMQNPNNLMRFFIDNTPTGQTNEYGPGNVALVRLWDGILSQAQITNLAANPFSVPEPGKLLLTGAVGTAGLLKLRSRRKAA